MSVFLGIIFFCVFIPFSYDIINNTIHKANNEISVSLSSDDFIDKNYEDVYKILSNDGFTNISLRPVDDLILGWFAKEGDVSKVTINGFDKFEQNEWFDKKSDIVIEYHVFEIDE